MKIKSTKGEFRVKTSDALGKEIHAEFTEDNDFTAEVGDEWGKHLLENHKHLVKANGKKKEKTPTEATPTE